MNYEEYVIEAKKIINEFGNEIPKEVAEKLEKDTQTLLENKDSLLREEVGQLYYFLSFIYHFVKKDDKKSEEYFNLSKYYGFKVLSEKAQEIQKDLIELGKSNFVVGDDIGSVIKEMSKEELVKSRNKLKNIIKDILENKEEVEELECDCDVKIFLGCFYHSLYLISWKLDEKYPSEALEEDDSYKYLCEAANYGHERAKLLVEEIERKKEEIKLQREQSIEELKEIGGRVVNTFRQNGGCLVPIVLGIGSFFGLFIILFI